MLRWRMKFMKIQEKLNATTENSDLRIQKSKLRDEFSEALHAEFSPVKNLQAALIAKIKNELGIGIQSSEIETQFDEMTKLAFKELNDFISEVEKEYGNLSE